MEETWTEVISIAIAEDVWSVLCCSWLDIFQCLEGNVLRRKEATLAKTPVNINQTSSLKRQKYSKHTTLARTTTFRTNTEAVPATATKEINLRRQFRNNNSCQNHNTGSECKNFFKLRNWRSSNLGRQSQINITFAKKKINKEPLYIPFQNTVTCHHLLKFVEL
jgi:hypothetical protein